MYSIYDMSNSQCVLQIALESNQHQEFYYLNYISNVVLLCFDISLK